MTDATKVYILSATGNMTGDIQGYSCDISVIWFDCSAI